MPSDDIKYYYLLPNFQESPSQGKRGFVTNKSVNTKYFSHEKRPGLFRLTLNVHKDVLCSYMVQIMFFNYVY